MLTLSLLRHGKSSWDDPGLEDFRRPLAKRGVKAAGAMAAFLAGSGLRPDLILCSTSVRTRATLDLVLGSFRTPRPEVRYEDELYLATPADLLDRLHRLDAAVRHVMLVGHNPGLHRLALDLVRIGRRGDITALATKFPTLGLAVITFEATDWSQVRPASGRLARFVVPKALA